jgi:type I restriction enzyme M protein
VDKGWACDLVPKALIVARYFAKEQAAIDELDGGIGEHRRATGRTGRRAQGGDEAAFPNLDKINKASVTDRLSEINGSTTAEARTKPPR